MNDLRVTNWLLAGILGALLCQILLQQERPVSADTLRLDFCITEKMTETPQQYLHVVPHPVKSS